LRLAAAPAASAARRRRRLLVLLALEVERLDQLLHLPERVVLEVLGPRAGLRLPEVERRVGHVAARAGEDVEEHVDVVLLELPGDLLEALAEVVLRLAE